VHGVAAAFLDIGRAKGAKPPPGQHRFTKVRQIVIRILLKFIATGAAAAAVG
jgi:hypothetical protein